MFDLEKSLKFKYYDIVIFVYFFYYDEYIENFDGVVVSKGMLYFYLLGKVFFDVELLGRIFNFWVIVFFFVMFLKSCVVIFNFGKFMVVMSFLCIF